MAEGKDFRRKVQVILDQGRILLGSSESSKKAGSSLKTLLQDRILKFLDATSTSPNNEANEHRAALVRSELETLSSQLTEKRVKAITALLAAKTLDRIGSIAEEYDDTAKIRPSTSKELVGPAPLFGVKDLKTISILAGVVARWGLGLMSGDLLPNEDTESDRHQAPDQQETLGFDCFDIAQAILPLLNKKSMASDKLSSNDSFQQVSGEVKREVFLPLVSTLLEVTLSSDSKYTHVAQEQLDRILDVHGPRRSIEALLHIIHKKGPNPKYGSVLSNYCGVQSRRPGGIRVLLTLMTDKQEIHGNLGRLDAVARLIANQAVGSELRFKNSMAQLLDILETAHSSNGKKHGQVIHTPLNVLRAAGFVISFLLDKWPDRVASFLQVYLHSQLLLGEYPPKQEILAPEKAQDESIIAPPLVPSNMILHGLRNMSTLALCTPPSSKILPVIIEPIIPTLLSLLSYLHGRVSDPVVGKEAKGLLQTWAKAVETLQVIGVLSTALVACEDGKDFGGDAEDSLKFEWAPSEDGSVCIRRKEKGIDLTNSDSNPQMRVSPEVMVEWLESLKRKDMTSGLFIRWLGELQILREDGGFVAAQRMVFRLQVVLKMIDQLSPSEILQKPTEILTFVAQALATDADQVPIEISPRQSSGGRLADLSNIQLDENDSMGSNERDGTWESAIGSEEMVMTALTLLLAVLEGAPELKVSNTPQLSVIHDSLSRFMAHPNSEIIPPLARECRLVLSSRAAADLSEGQKKTKKVTKNATLGPNQTSNGHLEETSQDVEDGAHAESQKRYQEALLILQDPVLPVRAHGLVILRNLVIDKAPVLSTNPAVLPAILDIFVQTIEDEDSFLYLNAIQGLTSMVESYGYQMLRKLMKIYAPTPIENPLHVIECGKGEEGRRELDKRLRIGEVIVQIIQQPGVASSLLVDVFCPPALATLRQNQLPTILRSSALTILAAAISIDPLESGKFAWGLIDTCLTLLTLESRQMKPRLGARATVQQERIPDDTESNHEPLLTPYNEKDEDEDEDNAILSVMKEIEAIQAPSLLDRHGKPKRPEELPDPTITDSKHPTLRRAAILLLAMIFRAERDAREEAGQFMHGQLLGNGRMRLPSQTAQTSLSQPKISIQYKQRVQARTVLRYIMDTDEDSLVRHQASEVLDEITPEE